MTGLFDRLRQKVHEMTTSEEAMESVQTETITKLKTIQHSTNKDIIDIVQYKSTMEREFTRNQTPQRKTL